ncbi:FAD-binding protein [Sporosarcina sp. G11-34]|nr:FAD-linked oxidase C-terminal domain-containing protein [Sporosarcina sp. G11-34]MCZ2258311.1 FAD-binding protein [Sporosarcina sp. G11-34]
MNYLNELLSFLPKDQVSTNINVLEHHSKDESYHPPSLPDVVVFPRNAEEVSQVMKIATKHHIPVVPYGLGTSLEGHIIPYAGGITLDFSLMDKILDVLPGDFLVKVQPGVTRSQLNNELKKHGLFFSVDPGADATLGGMAATNASGTTSVRYGIMRDQVRDLEVVLADGTIIHTGNMAVKSSSGYNLNGLFVGSEGTLGCFTKLTLKVYGIPEATVAARASFTTIDQAVQAVVTILSAGIQIARIELLDEKTMERVNRHSETNYEVLPTLFMEFHGNTAGLQRDVEFSKELLADLGCQQFKFEQDTRSQNQLWEARHNVAYAYIHTSPGKKMMVTDVCLPLSQLAGGIEYAKKLMDDYLLEGGIVGHVGDGNYHVLLMLNMDDAEEVRLGDKFNKEIVEYALQRGGSCTGEHGVGVGKLKYQEMEHGKSLVAMKAIKQALDPLNILNPGKLINV